MNLAKHSTSMVIGIFLYGLILFTVGLDHHEIIGFESRFYLFAMEMWRHGPSWFSTTYHQPYPDYPGTGTFFIYLFSKMMGELDKFTAIFPSACAAALTLCVTYLIGALHSRRWGLAAVCFLLFTNAFVAEARTISLDQYTTLVTVLCFYVVCSGRRTAWIFPLLAFGFAMRGPIGLVIPTGVVCAYYFLERDVKRFFIVGVSASLLLVICMGVLLGLAQHVGGASFVRDVLQLQAFGRINDVKPLPWNFYLAESMGAYALSYPLAILILLGIRKIELPQKQFLQKLLGWAVIIVLGLSFPSDKKIRYILPFAPALALICGYLVTVSCEKKYLYVLQKIFHYFCLIFPALCLGVLVVVRRKYPEIELSHSLLVSFFILMQIVVFLLHWRMKDRDLGALFAASFTFVMAYVFIVEPINLQLNQTRSFVQQAEAMRMQQPLVFYQEGTDGLVIKYLVNQESDDQPVFLQEPGELKRWEGKGMLVGTEENFNKIPNDVGVDVVLRGRLGREKVVVFRVR